MIAKAGAGKPSATKLRLQVLVRRCQSVFDPFSSTVPRARSRQDLSHSEREAPRPCNSVVWFAGSADYRARSLVAAGAPDGQN
jgi:hypothetical protein